MAIEPSGMRFVSYLSGIPYTDIQTGVYPNEMEWFKAQDAIKDISEGNLFITDGSSKDIYKICSIIRKYYLKYGIKIAFVDYLGEIEPDEQSKHGESDYDTFGRWVQQLKHLASYLKIPIIIATQLNREAYDEHVSMKHIAGSFKIIQKADIAIALEPKTDKDLMYAPEGSGNYFIKIIKQRNGPYPLTFDIQFNKETVTFIERGLVREERLRR
jgi:replicative DNA helicase